MILFELDSNFNNMALNQFETKNSVEYANHSAGFDPVTQGAALSDSLNRCLLTKQNKNGVPSRTIMSSLRRGHANLLCIVPIFCVSVRPDRPSAQKTR